MIRVGVNGYGTIGRRVADAVKKQQDMELVGVTAVHPHYKYAVARDKGLQLYALDTPAALSTASKVLQSPVVLHDTTLTASFPFAASKLHWATNDWTFMSSPAPPLNIDFTLACE